MPANYIQLATASGRLFQKTNTLPGKPNATLPHMFAEENGLVGVIDLRKDKLVMTADLEFNSTGDAVLLSDSRNQVTLMQLAQNRFSSVVQNLPETSHSCSFLAHDQCLVSLQQKKLLQVYLLASTWSKLLQTIQTNLHHKLEVKSASTCNRKGLALTRSSDAVALWSVHPKQGLIKVKSL